MVMGQPESTSPIVQGRTSRPVVDHSWKKRETLKRLKVSFSARGVLVRVATAVVIFLTYRVLTAQLGVPNPLLWYLELFVFVGFLLSIITDPLRYLYICLVGAPVEVTEREKQLLGVKDNDPGFTLSPSKSPASSETETSLVFSSSPTSQGPYSPTHSPWSTPSLGHVTPTNLSHVTSLGSISGSYGYASPSPSAGSGIFDRSSSFSQSFNASGYSANLSQNLPYSPGMSMSSLDSSGLRSRLNLSTSFRSPSPTDKLSDITSLSQYLKEQDEKEYRASLSSPDLSFGSQSFWSYGRPSLDCSHMLRKNQYQLASRSPQSHKSRSDDKDSGGEEVWGPLGVTDNDLYLWIERLRKWIGNTIMVKLNSEIDNINAALRKIGCEDTEIGEVGVATLKQLALTKGLYVPTLNVMVHFLDFHANQEYLVKRIRELGADGCISEYSWSSGGNRNSFGKSWGEHLPTDAALVMHMFCTYMDSRLPPEMKFPDGKTFSSQYFLKTPDKPNLEKDNLLLYQTSINPPHFQVIIKDKIHNLPKGRNNLFHAILFFLYHVKTAQNGMLGRVNLGMSGVKILSVIAD